MKTIRYYVMSVLLVIAASGCGASTPTAADANSLIQEGAGLSNCEAIGRAAPDGGQIHAYDQCVKDGGL